jgi:acetyl esterase/lipase
MTDLTMSCESWDSNADVDVITFPRDPTDHMNPVVCYLGEEGMKTYLTHPYASPLFGDFTGLPPMLIQNGDSEVIRDEGTLLAHKASMAGVEVSHEMYEDAVSFFFLSETLSKHSLRPLNRSTSSNYILS